MRAAAPEVLASSRSRRPGAYAPKPASRGLRPPAPQP